ncbi:hypothetical protein [Paeniglutamicibacter gangotriensis]|uniref:Lipoprotein n=1 Tax=Paeniglutamicibacter gangotriensis Lz1y TaxID=1276920 RepID=M7N4Y9_9MICC|nr:hypothetical protein [Paeniglutamicibacter gangotriensis]EMQ96814.1 hypothetical protein ADIAG_03951 [Paeniglutamicibacter gangotriensis Lz1y]
MTITRRALLSATTLVFLAGCAPKPDPAPPAGPAQFATQQPPGTTVSAPGSTSTGPPVPAQQQAAIEALTLMTTWHTDSDATQTSADLRARTYFTQELAATITAPARNGASGEWFDHPHSVSMPRVLAVEGTDSLVPGSLAYEVTWDWVDTAGKTTPGASVRLYSLAMANTPQGWKVSDYTYEEYPRHS